MSQFDWDPAKAEANLRKHGVSFDEAEAVINDAPAWIEVDPTDPSNPRTKSIGWSSRPRLLVVITSASGPRPRIISARRATKRERHAYEDRRL